MRADVSLESEEGKESVGAMEGGRELGRRRGSWAQAGQRSAGWRTEGSGSRWAGQATDVRLWTRSCALRPRRVLSAVIESLTNQWQCYPFQASLGHPVSLCILVKRTYTKSKSIQRRPVITSLCVSYNSLLARFRHFLFVTVRTRWRLGMNRRVVLQRPF